MEFFATPAYAQGAGAAGGFDPIGFFVPLIGIFAVMYFLLIRPQQRRAKEHQAMIDAVRRGDEIITSGGFYAKVSRVLEGEDSVEAEISEGVKIRVVKSMIATVVAKTEPNKAEVTRQKQPRAGAKPAGKASKNETKAHEVPAEKSNDKGDDATV